MKNSPREKGEKKIGSKTSRDKRIKEENSDVRENRNRKEIKAGKYNKAEKENKAGKEDKGGKYNKAGKKNKAEKEDKAGKYNKAEKDDKTEKQNKAGKQNKIENKESFVLNKSRRREHNNNKPHDSKQEKPNYIVEKKETAKGISKINRQEHADKNTSTNSWNKEIQGKPKEGNIAASKDRTQKAGKKKKCGQEECPYSKKCGGCHYLDLPYEEQLKIKQKQVSKLLSDFCKVNTIIGMEYPYHYRNKVQAVFGRDAKGNIISGVYKEGTHQIIPTTSCLIEDKKADEIIGTIRGMLKSFKIKTYDEDTGFGLLRYVLVKRGFTSGEIMVVLVIASPILPSKNNFVTALRKAHPEITTIVLNINNRTDSLILGDRETVLYGKGYIEDTLCGNVFRISSKSFYQVNPVQTERLYQLAIKAAGLTGKERVIDAYCGIGTIGLVASKYAKEVLGIEVNKEAVKDAIANAKRNGITNEQFYNTDATEFMIAMAEKGEKADVVIMDPPRAGSTEQFIDAVECLQPGRVVYISCNPVTLQRDLKYFIKKGYQAKEAWLVDMFPWTVHVETVVLMSRKESK